MAELQPENHLPKAFEKCGLVPLNRNKVLERLPSIARYEEAASYIDQALLKKLEVRRFGESKKKSRGKKVPAGKSYTENEDDSEVEDLNRNENDSKDEDDVD